MDINNMTIEELEKEIEKRKLDTVYNKPIKEGFLKHDLYGFNSQYTGQPTSFDINCYCDVDVYSMTKEEANDVIENFKAHIIPYIKKGVRFVCYRYNNRDWWYDDINYGLEQLGNIWAAKHLENVRDI